MLFHGIYVLNKDPYVVAMWGDDAWQAVAQSSRRPDVLLWHCAWYQGTLARMGKLKYRFYQMQKLGVLPQLVVNAAQEERYRRRFGIAGFKSSSYVFVDEHKYLLQDYSKKYQAVYAAQLKDFKRIPLAQQIKKLYVMTYKSGADRWDLTSEYPEMQNADFNRQWIDPEKKNQLLNESSVGLCLSAEEGPMLASLEYMLNGLPVVSTPSKGGRDEYYHQDYCRIVSPDPQAVRQGVEELIQLEPSPHTIRERTIDKLQADRMVYAQYVSQLLREKFNHNTEPEVLLKKWFEHPKDNFVPLAEL